MKSIQTRISIVIIVMMLLATGTLMVTAMLRSRSLISSDADEIILSSADDYAGRINDKFRSSEQSVRSIYNYALKRAVAYPNFVKDEKTREGFTGDIHELAKSVAENTKGAMTVYLRYNPETIGPTAGFWYTYDPKSKTWQSSEPTDLSIYDKDDIEHVGWYYTAINEGKPVWMSPYVNRNIGVEMISYIIPYFRGEYPVGVIGMDIDIGSIREEVAGIDVYKNGNAFLMTGDGDIIYHEKYKNGILFKDLPEDEQRQFKDILGFERDKVVWYRLFSSQPSKIILKDLDNGMIFGIAVSRYQLAEPQIKLIRQMVSRSLIILVISVIIGVLWIRSIIRPLQKMTDVADRYASGDYSEQMVIDSKDEVGRLSRSLQTMSSSLVEQIEIADSANKAKSNFLSNMSHEIRTPITAILGFNEMILREADDKDVLTYSENIRMAGNMLLGLINDVLDFSKIEAGKIEIVPVDYDMSSVINDLVNMVSIRADEKGLVLKADFDRDMPKLLNGDEIRIKQIITNILTNAIKYTQKGSIAFEMDYTRDDTDPDSVFINVAVQDTGIGIKKEDMEKLFAEFERIDEKRNRNIEGTGLGMNITKSLLEMMGSSLQVESEYGVGSRFSFSLKQKVVKWEPLGDYKKQFSAGFGDRGHKKSAFTAPDAHVLMVDDNDMNLLVFKNLVKQTLVLVDTVSSGDECLAMCRNTRYDIIFLDHMMPGKDGIETLRELKEMEDSLNLETPVICLTANAVSGAREEYISEGFDDYLTKPIDSHKLEEMMMTYLPGDKVRHPSEGIKIEFDAVKERDPDLSEDADPKEKEVDIDLLRDQELIDVDAGIYHCGYEDVYKEILCSFYETADDVIDELEGYVENDDIKNYKLRVHTVKSSSRTIGAFLLGDVAESLEKAGKNQDMDYIREHNEELVKEYKKVKTLLERAVLMKL